MIARFLSGSVLALWGCAAFGVDWCSELSRSNKEIQWECSSPTTARLTIGSDQAVVLGRNRRGGVELALHSLNGTKATDIVRLGVGSGSLDLCRDDSVKLSVVSLVPSVDQSCSADDALCRIVQTYSPKEKIIIQRTGLDALRVDDGACDAIWIYTSPESGSFQTMRLN